MLEDYDNFKVFFYETMGVGESRLHVGRWVFPKFVGCESSVDACGKFVMLTKLI